MRWPFISPDRQWIGFFGEEQLNDAPPARWSLLGVDRSLGGAISLERSPGVAEDESAWLGVHKPL
jgi:hypothetical protein